MKKLLLLLFILFSVSYSQNYKFAWITDIHIGYPEADTELDSVVALINSIDSVKFTLVTGDIAEKGSNSELQTAFNILEKLKKPYHIIPGNHDTKWSESGLTKFIDLFDDDKFYFREGDDIFIGLNSGIPWRGGGGHISPEDLKWLKEKLSLVKSENVFFTVHHPLNESIDNWFKVTNLLREKNIRFVFAGHTHRNLLTNYNRIPAAEGRSTLSKNKDSWGFTLVESVNDSLKFFEVERDTVPNMWGAIALSDSFEVPYVDSLQYDTLGTEVIWHKELNASLNNEPIIADSMIIAAGIDGIITALDSAGNQKWIFDAFGNIMSKPVYSPADGIIAAGTAQGDIVTIDTAGMSLQTIGFNEAVTSGLLIIDYEGNKRRMIPREGDSKTALVFGTESGSLFCYDLVTMEQLWVNRSAKGMIQATPVFKDGKIYYGSWDSRFYCVDAKTGWMVWQWKNKDNFYYSPAACQPVFNKDNIYFTTPDKITHAVDLLLGNTVWQSDKFGAWESVGISGKGHRLFIKSYKDEFAIAAAKNGHWVKRLNIGFGVDTMPVTPIEFNGDIIYGTKDGYIRNIDSRFNPGILLFTGTARTFTVVPYGNGTFLASNMDGHLILFKYKE